MEPIPCQNLTKIRVSLNAAIAKTRAKAKSLSRNNCRLIKRGWCSKSHPNPHRLVRRGMVSTSKLLQIKIRLAICIAQNTILCRYKGSCRCAWWVSSTLPITKCKPTSVFNKSSLLWTMGYFHGLKTPTWFSLALRTSSTWLRSLKLALYYHRKPPRSWFLFKCQ